MHSSAQMEKMLGVLYTLPQSAWVFQDRMLGVCNREACVYCHRRTYDDTNDELGDHSLQLTMGEVGNNASEAQTSIHLCASYSLTSSIFTLHYQQSVAVHGP